MKLTSIKKAEFVRNVFAVVVPAGTDFQDFEKPENLAHIAASLHRGDRIEVATEDGLKFAEFYVVAAGKNWARLSVINSRDFNEHSQTAPPDSEFYITWGSEKTQFRVHRKSDKQVLKSGFTTKELAEAWFKETYVRSAVARELV